MPIFLTYCLPYFLVTDEVQYALILTLSHLRTPYS